MVAPDLSPGVPEKNDALGEVVIILSEALSIPEHYCFRGNSAASDLSPGVPEKNVAIG